MRQAMSWGRKGVKGREMMTGQKVDDDGEWREGSQGREKEAHNATVRGADGH